MRGTSIPTLRARGFRERWNRDKDLLLERAGLQFFAEPRKVLDNLDEALHVSLCT